MFSFLKRTITVYVRQGKMECVGAVAAMITGTSLIDFKKYWDSLPPYPVWVLWNYVKQYGWIENERKDFDNGKGKLKKGMRAVVVVKNPSNCQAKYHAIYWDGRKLWNPGSGTVNPSVKSCYLDYIIYFERR